MNIIEVAENAKEIAADQDVYCPRCGEKQFSIFDKLYACAYDMCVTCETDVDEYTRRGENILEIINECL